MPDNAKLRDKDGVCDPTPWRLPQFLESDGSYVGSGSFSKEDFWQQSNEGIKEIIRLRNNFLFWLAKRTAGSTTNWGDCNRLGDLLILLFFFSFYFSTQALDKPPHPFTSS